MRAGQAAEDEEEADYIDSDDDSSDGGHEGGRDLAVPPENAFVYIDEAGKLVYVVQDAAEEEDDVEEGDVNSEDQRDGDDFLEEKTGVDGAPSGSRPLEETVDRDSRDRFNKHEGCDESCEAADARAAREADAGEHGSPAPAKVSSARDLVDHDADAESKAVATPREERKEAREEAEGIDAHVTAPRPLPRINPCLTVRGNTLYVYGGLLEVRPWTSLVLQLCKGVLDRQTKLLFSSSPMKSCNC